MESENKKHLHRLKYYEKKAATKRLSALFQPYGGEAAYYKNRLIELGVLFGDSSSSQSGRTEDAQLTIA